MKQTAIHSVALAPRLSYCMHLINDTLDMLQCELDKNSTVKGQDLRFCLEAIFEVRERTRAVSSMAAIPLTFPPIIPVIRAASARLAITLPSCSNNLCELAVHMGSMTLDSAIISGVSVNTSGRIRQTSLVPYR